jgi:hypothetical protein
MRTKYIDLIDQTFDFPQNEFFLREDRLFFHGIDLMRLVHEHGTPLKFHYLPQISNNIQRANGWFREAIMNLGYQGNYYYSYCTKSSHFAFVLDEVLKNNVHIETSSAFDIDIVKSLQAAGKLQPKSYVICNGYKPTHYIEKIADLIEEDDLRVVPVVDNIDELKQLQRQSADELAAMLAKIEQKAAAARTACRVRDAAANRTRQALIIARRPSYSPARTLSPAALAPSRHPSPPACATTTTGAPNERASRSPDERPPTVRSPASPKGAELGTAPARVPNGSAGSESKGCGG